MFNCPTQEQSSKRTSRTTQARFLVGSYLVARCTCDRTQPSIFEQAALLDMGSMCS